MEKAAKIFYLFMGAAFKAISCRDFRTFEIPLKRSTMVKMYPYCAPKPDISLHSHLLLEGMEGPPHCPSSALCDEGSHGICKDILGDMGGTWWDMGVTWVGHAT